MGRRPHPAGARVAPDQVARVETLSAFALVVLLLMVVNNHRRGTAGDWFRAKVLNAGDPPPASGQDASYSGGAFLTPSAFTGGQLRPPVPGAIISPWHASRDGGARLHEGVDVAASRGEPVHASQAGRVTVARTSGNYGLWVEVDHGNGLATRYAHLLDFAVRAGQTVTAGQVIGTADNTGNARNTATHVHFEVRRNGVPVDPTTVVAGFGAV